jgi:phenylacetate-CoA ligase
MTAESLYLHSPVWLQNALIAGYGWWWYRRRFGPDYHALVDDLRLQERWTARQYHAYQTGRLAAVLRAAGRSRYYAPLLKAARADDRSPWETLARMPPLSKEQLRAHARDLLTETPPKDAIVFRSSGTTGTPTEIFYTRAFHSLEIAVIEARNLNWGKATYGDRRVMFGARKVCRFDQARPPFWRFSPAENLAYASVYHLSPANLPAYVQFLRRFQPVVVMGYPSALYAVAEHVRQRGDVLPGARGVFTSAERLPDYMRAAIEMAWQCPVFDRYGAVEGCVSATQCDRGRYHVNPEVGIIEIIDTDGRPAAPGEEGELVCTGLGNTLQPLIRYRIGDYGRWAVRQTCECRRQTPLLEGIDGRVEQCCVTADGRSIVRFDTVFKGVAHLREAQVIQDSLESFTIAVVPAPGFGPSDVETLRSNMRQHVGDAAVTVTQVEAIPRTSSGKFMAVVCNLSADDRNRYRAAVAADAAVRQ